jgi:hypothetical protein
VLRATYPKGPRARARATNRKFNRFRDDETRHSRIGDDPQRRAAQRRSTARSHAATVGPEHDHIRAQTVGGGANGLGGITRHDMHARIDTIEDRRRQRLQRDGGVTAHVDDVQRPASR